MEVNDLKIALRILKRNGVQKQDVAAAIPISKGHLSKIQKREKSLTSEFRDAFNDLYSKTVVLSVDSIFAVKSEVGVNSKLLDQVPKSNPLLTEPGLKEAIQLLRQIQKRTGPITFSKEDKRLLQMISAKIDTDNAP